MALKNTLYFPVLNITGERYTVINETGQEVETDESYY